MINHPIIKKEIITTFRREQTSKGKQVASLLGSALFNIALVAFVTVLFGLFYTKSYTIISTNGIPAPLLIFVGFIFLISCAYFVFSMNTIFDFSFLT